jgi:hypothetical protein
MLLIKKTHEFYQETIKFTASTINFKKDRQVRGFFRFSRLAQSVFLNPGGIELMLADVSPVIKKISLDRMRGKE